MNAIEIFLSFLSVSNSTFLVLLVKYIMVRYEFSWPILMASYHLFNLYLFLEISCIFGLIKRISPVSRSLSFIFSLVSVCSRIFQNLNLLNNSIGFYQLSKFSIFFVLDIINTIYNKQKLTSYPIYAGILLISGNIVYVMNDDQINFVGIVYALFSIAFLSLGQFLAFVQQKSSNTSGPSIQHSTSFYEAMISLILTVIFEFNSDSSILVHSFTTNESILIIVSGFIAILSNSVTISLASGQSSINFQLLDHFKSFVLFILSFIVFPISGAQKRLRLITQIIAFVLGMSSSIIISLYHSLDTQKESEIDSDQFGVEPENDVKAQETESKRVYPIIRRLLEDPLSSDSSDKEIKT